MGRNIRRKVALLLVLCASFSVSDVSAISRFRAIDVLNGGGPEPPSSVDLDAKEAVRSSDGNGDVQELYVKQKLNHFPEENDDEKSKTTTTTFRQRYFYSNRYAASPIISRTNDVPVYAFLCVGGEGPSLDKSVLVDSVHCSGDMLELARRLHENEQAIVHVFALEHRYYGESYPQFQDENGKSLSPVSNENLRFLSSRQALADLAHFVQTMNDSHEMMHSTAKWITFGGSYPGMLASWARSKFPQVIHAAVGNSAPIQMEVDFVEYNDRVAFDLQYALVGGSASCLQVVLDGHHELVGSIAAGYYKEIAKLFNICDADSLLLKQNVEMFVGDGVIEIPAQGNDPSCDESTCNIHMLCKRILEERKHSSPLEVMAAVSRIQKGDDKCLELDWNATLSFLASPEAKKEGLRSWLWQTCTEFGFYQTCEENSLCPFAHGYHTLETDFEICEQAFGVSREDVAKNVNKSLDYYGGRNIDGQRILSVNGDVDPWSMLALTKERDDAELYTHWVKGASHHFWTHAAKDTDGQEVMDAREIIYLKVMQWLEEDDASVSPLELEVKDR